MIAWAATAVAQDTKEALVPTVSTLDVTGRPFTDTIGLSASKTATAVFELPRSVSVVTAEEIRNRAPENLTQIFQYSAGFNGDAYGSGALKRSFSNARGFLAFQYLDGLKQHDSNWGIEPFGLERAELLRGPASSLYGQANPGGVVALTSKRPVATPLAQISVQAGSHKRLQGAIDLGGPVWGRGDLAYRFTALARDSDTEVDQTKDNRVFVSSALTWDVGDQTSLTLLASHQWDPELVVFQFLPRVGSVDAGAFGRVSRAVNLSEPGYDNTTKGQTQVATLLEHRLTDAVTLRQNFRYTYIDISARFLQGGGALAADQRTVSRTAVFQEFNINVAQVDTQAQARLVTGPATHSLLAGVDYAYIPSYQGQGARAGPTLDLYAPLYGRAFVAPVLTNKRQQHQRQTGLYLQDQVKIGELSILAGLRRDHATVTTRNRNALTGVAPTAIRQEDEKTTGQLGANYTLAGGLAPYVSYSTSFYPTPGADFFGAALIPSTGKQYEAGIKYQPPGVNGLVTAAVFDLKQQNVRTPDPAHPGFLVQTGEVGARGLELEGRASLTDRINVAAAYTYLDSEVTRSTTNTAGKRPPGRPRHQASAWADFTPVGAPFLTVGFGVRHVGRSFGDAANTFSVDAYTLADALLRLDLGRAGPAAQGLDLSVNALNLFDRRYVANCDTATQCFHGAGRLVKATLTKRW